MNTFSRALLIIICTLTSTAAFATEGISVEKNIIKDEIILPQNTKLPERDLNKDGVINSNDILTDDTEESFFLFKHLGDPRKEIIVEDTLFNKIGNSLQGEVNRTDYANYLLKDLLTMDFQKGPVDRIQFYGKYRGNLNFNFVDSELDTNYDVTSIDLGMMGSFSPEYKTDFKLQFKLTPTSDRNFFQQLISDAYIVNKTIPHHQILVGNSRNQVGFEGGMSTTYTPFIIRSQIARTFGNTRAFGVRVMGNYALVDYSLAANSSDRFFREFFPGAEFTGWVNFKPLGKTDGKYGKLVIGGGLNSGKNNHNYTVGGAYIGYNYKNFMANAEYSIADGYNARNFSTNKAEGFYTTIGYKIHPKVQLVARYDQFDPNRDLSGDLRREYTAGINYFIKGQGLRFLMNYIFCDNQNLQNSHRLLLGTQVLL